MQTTSTKIRQLHARRGLVIPIIALMMRADIVASSRQSLRCRIGPRSDNAPTPLPLREISA